MTWIDLNWHSRVLRLNSSSSSSSRGQLKSTHISAFFGTFAHVRVSSTLHLHLLHTCTIIWRSRTHRRDFNWICLLDWRCPNTINGRQLDSCKVASYTHPGLTLLLPPVVVVDVSQINPVSVFSGSFLVVWCEKWERSQVLGSYFYAGPGFRGGS